MRRAALAVLLSLGVPILLFGQHGGSGGSETYHSSSSSSSTSSSSSSSSSGSSHSSSSNSSSGSSSGSSSHSNSGGASSSRGSGSSGSRAGAGGSVGTHPTTGSSASRSNLRTRSSDSSSANSNRGSSGTGAGSRLYPGNVENQPPVQFRLQNEIPRSDLDKARQEGKLDVDFLKMGLEPNRQAYQQKMADLEAVEKTNSEKPQSRLSKILFGDREKNRQSALAAQSELAKPCVVGDCKPSPAPCAGKNCRPMPCKGAQCPPPASPPPSPPVVNTGCAYLATGFAQPDGYCQPLGYIDHCDANGQCYAHLGRVNGYYCDTILQRLKQEQKQAAKALNVQGAACSSDPQSEQCVSATNDYQASWSLMQQLATQYQMCRAAAGLGPANLNLGPAVVTGAPSTP